MFKFDGGGTGGIMGSGYNNGRNDGKCKITIKHFSAEHSSCVRVYKRTCARVGAGFISTTHTHR